MSVTFCINPGSGPVADASMEEAEANIRQLIEDIGVPDVTYHRDEEHDYGDGRYCFVLQHGDRESEIQMPGIPVDRVRFLGANGQNIWHFPRLYVDGSSWVWKYAINCAKADLIGEDDED